MKTIGVTARGLEPGLLMSSPESMLQMDDGKKKTPKELSRSELAERSAYRLSNGNLCFPAVAFQRALMAAMKGAKVQPISAEGRKQGKEVSLTGLLSAMWGVEPKDLIPLMIGKKPIKDYRIDVRTGLNRNKKPAARIVLVRPLIFPWETSFDIVYDDEAAPGDTADQLRKYLERAGRVIGVGAFRPYVESTNPPQTGGWFGKFEVMEWEEA